MTTTPRFVRFTAPFWFGMQGYFDEQDGTVVDVDENLRQVLVSVGDVDEDAAYIGVVHTGSVLPVSRFDAASSTVTVRLPEPWSDEQEGLPLDPDVVVAVDGQDEPPRVESLTRSQAREMFPGEFESLTQDGLDAMNAEDGW